MNEGPLGSRLVVCPANNAAPQIALPASQRRVAIVAFPALFAYQLGDKSLTTSALGPFWNVGTTSAPFTLSLKEHGSAVQGDWWIRLAAGSGSVYLLEVYQM